MHKATQADRLEREVITAVSRGANTLPYVMGEFRWGERRPARRALYRALDDGKVLMTVERKLILPPEIA